MPTNAERAGWNLQDGDPPNEHGDFVPPLDSDKNLDKLKARIAEKMKEKK